MIQYTFIPFGILGHKSLNIFRVLYGGHLSIYEKIQTSRRKCARITVRYFHRVIKGAGKYNSRICKVRRGQSILGIDIWEARYIGYCKSSLWCA